MKECPDYLPNDKKRNTDTVPLPVKTLKDASASTRNHPPLRHNPLNRMAPPRGIEPRSTV